MMHGKRNDRNGFTLVELLIVLVILAILAAFLIPSMLGYLDKSKEGVCESNIATGIRLSEANIYADMISDPELTESAQKLQKSYTEFLTDYVSENAVCPSGGIITVSVETDGLVVVPHLICSKHGDQSHEVDYTQPKITFPKLYAILSLFSNSVSSGELKSTINSDGIIAVKNKIQPEKLDANGAPYTAASYINSLIKSQSFDTFVAKTSDFYVYYGSKKNAAGGEDIACIMYKYAGYAYFYYPGSQSTYKVSNAYYSGNKTAFMQSETALADSSKSGWELLS